MIASTIVAIVLTMDPFCCADGCTDGNHSTVATSSSCGLCHGVIVPAVATGLSVAPAWIVPDEPAPMVPRPLTRRIDHPPRPHA